MDRRQARAFEEYVGRSGDTLMRTAVLMTADRGVAEDVYQETLQRLARRWARVENPHSFCLRIMHNLVIDQARARARRPLETELFDGHDPGDPRSRDQHHAVELRPSLLEALGSLTASQRAIVVLRYFEDRSEAEVAALLGVSTGTVKSTASRAAAQLRQHPALTGLLSTPSTKGH